jgi:purine nucleosidase
LILGPMTNVALALNMDPSIASKLRHVTVMGGSIHGKGNASLSAEFNFLCDPEAAHLVMKSFKADKCDLVTWDLVEQHQFSWETYDELTNARNVYSNFLKKTTASYESIVRHNNRDAIQVADNSASASVGQTLSTSFATNELTPPLGVQDGQPLTVVETTYIPCDAFAMALLIAPELCKRSHTTHGVVELEGKYTRGSIVYDWYGARSKSHPPNMRVVDEMDAEGFCALIKHLTLSTNPSHQLKKRGQ